MSNIPDPPAIISINNARMSYILAIIGIVGAFFMIIKRETIGDTLGEAEWMDHVGGVYNLVVYAAVFVFFWSIATLTGTTDLLFKPFLWLVPGSGDAGIQPGGF
jgi:hypothetical protein